jgi:maleylacetoacetate isomerase
MILYDYFRSSAAYRVRIALGLKGLAAERRFVHLRRGEQHASAYREVNAQELVPTLEVDGKRIAQSLAIIEYLEERHPAPPLLPASAEDRAWVRSVALAIACDIHPIDNLRVLKYLAGPLAVDEVGRDAWYRHWIETGFAALETQLARRASGAFCFGAAPTLADVFLVPQVANARRAGLALDAFPRILAIDTACLALPAFDRARPENQTDAE